MQPSPYFSALGAAPYAPPMPPLGPPMYAQAGPSHSGFQHWYELHYLTESLQYFIQFLYFTLIESLLLNCPGFVEASYEYDNSGFNLEDLDHLDADDRDVLGSSQLGGAPPLPSQEPAFQTPEPTVRPSRQAASPDRLSYPTGHVHAQQRPKRVRRGRGG